MDFLGEKNGHSGRLEHEWPSLLSMHSLERARCRNSGAIELYGSVENSLYQVFPSSSVIQDHHG